MNTDSSGGRKISSRKHNRLFWIVSGFFFFCAAAGGVLILYYNEPTQTVWFPKCAFYKLTGFYCSGCGTTRALHAALHGHVLTAMRYNALLFPMLILIGCLLWKPRLALRPQISLTVLTVIVLYWIFRNIPVEPFLLLAPPS